MAFGRRSKNYSPPNSPGSGGGGYRDDPSASSEEENEIEFENEQQSVRTPPQHAFQNSWELKDHEHDDNEDDYIDNHGSAGAANGNNIFQNSWESEENEEHQANPHNTGKFTIDDESSSRNVDDDDDGDELTGREQHFDEEDILIDGDKPRVSDYQETYPGDDAPLQETYPGDARKRGAGYGDGASKTKLRMTVLFMFVLGLAGGFFLIFGLGARNRRNDDDSSNDRSVDILQVPTASPVASPSSSGGIFGSKTSAPAGTPFVNTPAPVAGTTANPTIATGSTSLETNVTDVALQLDGLQEELDPAAQATLAESIQELYYDLYGLQGGSGQQGRHLQYEFVVMTVLVAIKSQEKINGSLLVIFDIFIGYESEQVVPPLFLTEDTFEDPDRMSTLADILIESGNPSFDRLTVVILYFEGYAQTTAPTLAPTMDNATTVPPKDACLLCESPKYYYFQYDTNDAGTVVESGFVYAASNMNANSCSQVTTWLAANGLTEADVNDSSGDLIGISDVSITELDETPNGEVTVYVPDGYWVVAGTQAYKAGAGCFGDTDDMAPCDSGVSFTVEEDSQGQVNDISTVFFLFATCEDVGNVPLTSVPTGSSTTSPTVAATTTPMTPETEAPTVLATTEKPTVAATETPTVSPTTNPSDQQTSVPTKQPTQSPSKRPTQAPTQKPTDAAGPPPPADAVYGLQPDCSVRDDTKFNICLDISSESGQVEEWFPDMIAAKERWERVITKDRWGPWDKNTLEHPIVTVATEVPDGVDDIYVSVVVGNIDGKNGRYAEAGQDLVQGGSRIIAGSIKIDPNDIQTVLDNRIFDWLMLHELGHIMGIGKSSRRKLSALTQCACTCH